MCVVGILCATVCMSTIHSPFHRHRTNFHPQWRRAIQHPFKALAPFIWPVVVPGIGDRASLAYDFVALAQDPTDLLKNMCCCARGGTALMFACRRFLLWVYVPLISLDRRIHCATLWLCCANFRAWSCTVGFRQPGIFTPLTVRYDSYYILMLLASFVRHEALWVCKQHVTMLFNHLIQLLISCFLWVL